MADNFLPMGATPDFYAKMMQDAQQQLVRMPDGSLQPAPQFSQPTSVNDLYAGMSRPAPLPSPAYDSVGSGFADSGGWSQFDDQFNPTPLPNRTMTASRAEPSVPGPRGSVALNKDASRLDPGTALAFAGETSAPGVAAINRAITPMPHVPVGPGAAYFGGWGSDALGRFLSGDPGEVDFSKTRPDTTDVFGRPYSPAVRGALDAMPQKRTLGLLDQVITSLGGGGSPAAPTPNVTNNIDHFLSEQGQNTTGMTAGEQANALRDAMGGSHNGEFH